MSSNLQKQLFLFESTTLKYLLYKKYLKKRRSVVNSIIFKDLFLVNSFTYTHSCEKMKLHFDPILE